MIRHYSLLLLAVFSYTQMMAQGRLVINEIMQSNMDYMMVDHDFPDSWVELYNGSGKTIAIRSYRIGPTNVFSDSYILSSTAVNIEPGGYQILYCDKTTGTPFHYNFNLEAGIGELFLFDNKGVLVDSVIYNRMPAPNIAYGRVTDGSDEWQYELTPTPGAPNDSMGSDEVLPEPLFSIEGHIMTNGSESVNVSMPEGVPEDTRIYLTLDGSEPTWESASDTHFTLEIDRSTVVRAKLLSHEMHPIRSTTHSYIFHPRETNIPIVSIAADSTYLYSSEDGMLSNDSTDGIPNYKQGWRRPANFEYFRTKDGTTVFNQCGEMEVGGAKSREMPQKSIKCYAKKRFGKKNFQGDFWSDKPDVTKVKSFMLRNGGNNCKISRIDDAAIQRIFGRHIDDLDWQAYEPAIVYINGVYKGIYEFRERSNDLYVESNYDIDDDDVARASHNLYRRESIEKSSPLFHKYRELYLRDDVTYEEMASATAVKNFMNCFIAECYSSNTDYPHNNVSMWRQITESGDTAWHWILKDLDYISRHDSSWDMFKYMLGTTDPTDQEYALSTQEGTVLCRRIYEKMISFPEFRNDFIASYATYLGDFLRPDVCLPIIREIESEIIDEIVPTSEAYGNMFSLRQHNKNIERLCNYVASRPTSVYNQMADYFSLGSTVPVTIENSSETAKETILICGTPLRTGRFEGAWFSQFPISIEYSGESNVAWMMTVAHTDGTESISVYDTPYIQPSLSSCVQGDSVTFVMTDMGLIDGVSINTDNTDRNTDVCAIYDAAGRKISAMQRGLNIVCHANGTRKKIVKY